MKQCRDCLAFSVLMYTVNAFGFLSSFSKYELEEESRDMEAKQKTVGKGFHFTQYYPECIAIVNSVC